MTECAPLLIDVSAWTVFKVIAIVLVTGMLSAGLFLVFAALMGK